MTKTHEALRIELEDLKNSFYDMDKSFKREKVRTDRIVQVLLNNLPKENLDMVIRFEGTDCDGNYRWWPDWRNKTLRDFLVHIIDP